jgi:hypothetical protein
LSACIVAGCALFSPELPSRTLRRILKRQFGWVNVAVAREKASPV